MLKKIYKRSNLQFNIICVKSKLTVTDISLNEKITSVHCSSPKNVGHELDLGQSYMIRTDSLFE